MKKRFVKTLAEKLPAKDSAYNYGADSMLRCYNATEWRLEDWLKEEDEPPGPPAKPPRRK